MDLPPKLIRKQKKHGLNIKLYYKGISKDKYFVDQEFYSSHGITESQLLQLNLRDTLVVSDNITEGIYDNGSRGYAPSWVTRDEFRWKLSIDLQERIEFINNNGIMHFGYAQ